MSLFDDDMYDDWFGLGGPSKPIKKRKNGGYCEHCGRRHSVDFVHDFVGPILGVAVLGFTIGALGGLLRSQQP